MDVTLPNGVTIRGVPDNATKDQIRAKAISSGLAQESDFGVVSEQPAQQANDVPLVQGMQGYEQQQSAQQANYANRQEPSLIDKVQAIPQVAGTLLSGATTGLIGQGAGLAQQLAKEIASGQFGSQESANRVANRTAEVGGSATYQPTNPVAQQMLGQIANIAEPMAGIAPLTGELRTIAQSAKLASPLAKTNLAPANAIEAIKQEAAIIAPPSQKNIDIIKKIQAGSTENELAPYKIEPKAPLLKESKSLKPTDYKLVPDDTAKKALDQEWESGTVQAVKNFDPKTAEVAARMLKVAQVGTKDDTFKANNRPIAEMGYEFARQVAQVKAAKKKAGNDIDKEASLLKNERVDVAPAVDNFLSNVENNLGVKITPTSKGVAIDFRGSDLEGASAEIRSAQGVLRTLVSRMYNTRTPSAYDVHRLKKFIDSQVSYGSTLGGLKGETDIVVKGLRKELDDLLDNNFEQYRIANDSYRETKTALDSVQELVGKKVNLDNDYTPQALGKLSRRILSNAQSAERVKEAMMNIDEVAMRYGSGEQAGNLSALVKFADTLDKQFGIAADSSLASEIAKGTGQAIRGSKVDATGTMFNAAMQKIKGVNTDRKYQTMNELLDRQRGAKKGASK